MASSVLHPACLEQLAEVGRSVMEWMVEIPEGKGKSEAKDPKELPDWFSLIKANKAVPKPLIQSSALLNRDNGPWHGPLCASSSDAVHCGVRGLHGKKVLRGGREERQQDEQRTCRVVTGMDPDLSQGCGLRKKRSVWQNGE